MKIIAAISCLLLLSSCAELIMAPVLIVSAIADPSMYRGRGNGIPTVNREQVVNKKIETKR